MGDFEGEVMAEVLAERALIRPQIIPLVPLTNQYRHQDHGDLKDYKSKPEKCDAPRQKRKYEKKQKTTALSAGGAHLFNAKDLNQYDFPSSDDEPYSQLLSGSSEAEEENDPDGAFAFRRRAGCHYHAVQQEARGSWPWSSPSEGFQPHSRYRYSLTSLTVPRRCLGLARRRVGRGGRLILDRAHSDFDPVYHELYPERPEPPPSPPPPLSDRVPPLPPPPPADRRWHTDLTRLLLSIKACRWRHFRPRTLPLAQLDNAPPLFRRLSRELRRPTPNHTAANAPHRAHSRGGRTAHAFTQVLTAEQFQQHQEQLALMQKQQLEQQQHQTQPQGNTVDQAAAQFAASALVTPDQLLALKSKEDLPLGGAVNGVLSPSGVYRASLSSPAAPPSSPSALLPGSAPSPHNNNGTGPPAPPHSNSLRIGVLGPGKRPHAPRTVPSALGTAALKLAQCQKPRVPPVTTATLDMAPRENHEPDKSSSLNSLSENTVAMEVT